MTITDGFVDLQVNGYNGVDFNADQLIADRVVAACHRLREHGVAGILATVITDEVDAMCGRLNNIARIRGADPIVADVIWGIHVEGPFLNEQPGYIGAHPTSAARPACPELMQRLLAAGDGLVRLVTLAPERDAEFATTKMLARQDIRVSAGHCDPSLDELRGAIDAGLSMFTHLGNGCPLMMHRHDNIVQRVLNQADRLWIGLIADGIHVPFPTLANYIRCAGIARVCVVTDAIAAASQGPGKYQLAGQSVIVDEQLATWSADKSHLAGSAVTMPVVVERLRTQLGMSDAEIRQVTVTNPRAALGRPNC